MWPEVLSHADADVADLIVWKTKLKGTMAITKSNPERLEVVHGHIDIEEHTPLRISTNVAWRRALGSQ